MKEFLEAIEQNKELKGKIKELNKNPNATPADFVALAKEYGFTLTEADFTIGKRTGSELSDDELNAVAGGAVCVCTFAGGGLSGGNDGTCGCAVVGVGLDTDKNTRCMCPVGGLGDACSRPGDYY